MIKAKTSSLKIINGILLALLFILAGALAPAPEAKANPGNVFSISPAEVEVSPGDEFDIELKLNSEETSDSAGAVIKWSGSGSIQCTGIEEGPYYSDYASTMILGEEDYDPYAGFADQTFLSVTMLSDDSDASAGEGVLFILHFVAESSGSVDITIAEAQLQVSDKANATSIARDFTTENGIVTIEGGSADKPDLIIEEMTPEWVTQDETYIVNFIVKNKGGADSADFVVALYTDGESDPIVTETINGLASDDTYEGTFDDFEIELSDEEDELKLCADADKEITEGNEDNNCEEDVWPGIDLVVSDIAISWVEQDSTYEITYVIENKGGKSAADTITSISINGDTQFEACPEIASGSDYEGTFGPVTVSDSGLDTVKVCADAEEQIEESSEDNNCLQKKFPAVEEEDGEPSGEIGEKADLTISEYGRKWKKEGETYTVSYTIENTGDGDAGAFDVHLYLDGSEEPAATESVKGLKAGQTYEGNFGKEEMTVSDGEDDLRICADAENKVNESNEDNNCEEFNTSSSGEYGQSFPQVPEYRPQGPGITISWEYLGGLLGLVFLAGLLGFVLGRR